MDIRKYFIINNKKKINNLNFKYFYLYWVKSKIVIGFYKIQPEKVNFSKIINCRDLKSKIIICGYFKNNNNKNPICKIENIKSVFSNKSFSLLKSQLQKSIRKGLIDISLMTAFEMYLLNEIQFLRRLAIIIIEDVEYINKWFSIICWFICSYPLKKMDNNQIRYLFGFIKSLCLYKKFEYVKKHEIDVAEIIDGIKKFNFLERNCILSLLIRASYGGTSGDVKFLRCKALEYKNKFKNNFKLENNINVKPLTIIKRLEKNEIIFCACDFHINPKIIDIIAEKFKLEKQIIKKTIWHSSSNINFRKVEITKYNNIWLKIKKEYNKLARKYIFRVTR